MTLRADVVPLIRLGKAGSAYTYGVPVELQAQLARGQLVSIPFRSRRVSGVVVGLNAPADPRGIRNIDRIEDDQPVLRDVQLDLARWMSAEYAAPLADVIACMVPADFKKAPSSQPRLVSVSITSGGHDALAEQGGLARAEAQRRILKTLATTTDPRVVEKALLAEANAGRGALLALERKGWVVRAETVAERDGSSVSAPRPQEPAAEVAPALSVAQERAVSAIRTSLPSNADPAVFLLHGVTGSGKTEVYMSLIDETLRLGRQALVLVPEISLTPQAVDRFTARFPGAVAAFHSRLTQKQRRAAWQRIRGGDASIVIGPRSALFTPLERLGIIIVDEEHDGSYKQNESPRYHARDVAIRLGSMLRIPVILGSATPDVGSYFSARKGRMTLLELPQRPAWKGERSGTTPREMPPVEIIDLRQELKAGHRGIFSRNLETAIGQTLAASQQTLLFMNRRGTSTAVLCRDCGYVAACGRCDIPLTYHGNSSVLICHRCNLRVSPPKACRECGGERIRYLGVGTQRVADEIRQLFPKARVLRWDRDVSSGKDSHQTIMEAFGRHDADILVGTQMIAKGLDFPLVTLVGVIVADVGLHLPDFRSGERTFQLMTQVAGRAGRASLPSRVIVQTYSPEHYALRAAKNHDYWAFYQQEMTFRKSAAYPPFSRLVRLILRDRDATRLHRDANELREKLLRSAQTRGMRDFEVIGPAPAFTARVNRVFQWHMVLRGTALSDLMDAVPENVIVDVDPVDLL